MRLRKVVKRVTCCFAVGLSMCIGLLGGMGTTTAYAQETEDTAIGEAVAVEEAEESGFTDVADTVNAGATITFTGTYDYSQAFEILDLVNQERRAQGLNELVMDKELLEAAMLRAAEIAVLFDHTRPDGSRCFTVSDKCYGENIAINYSAEAVMDSWMGSSGHKNNILGSSKSIGIGCFTQGGHVYYVQCFGGASTDVASKPANKVASRSVYVSDAYMQKADIYTSDGVTYFTNLDWGYARIKLDAEEQEDIELPTYEDEETVYPNSAITTSYTTHIQNFGWSDECKGGEWETDGEISGSLGLSKRLEGIKIKLSGSSNLGIKYKTHIQTYGWEKQWKTDGEFSGTSGESKRLEAIMIDLTGSDKSKYDVFYRVHAQNYGWLGWAKNGEPAGTAGQSKRLEAIQVIVVPKGTAPSGIIGYSYIEVGKYADNGTKDGLINYSTHVQNYGDQSYVYDGSVSGTFGESKRLEGIRINLNNDLLGYSGNVKYTTHVQTYGWQGDPNDKTGADWKSNGAMSGTSGESKRLEAICIMLDGEVANHYDVYYRVQSQTFGWLGWAKNGAPAGTAGYSKRLEGIQIVLLPKGSAAPSHNPGDAGVSAYIQR